MTLHHVLVTLSETVVFSLAGPVPMITASVCISCSTCDSVCNR